MSEDEMNRKIAEALGWKPWKSKHGHWNVTTPEGETLSPMFGAAKFDPVTGEEIVRDWDAGISLPDWSRDLNACHEMEKTLDALHKAQYRDWLVDMAQDSYACFATAAQRCRAFLRVKGLLP